MRSILITIFLMASLLGPGLATAADCPTSRAYLEPRLNTKPEDGEYYAVQREAIRVPITDLVKRMGGPKQAYAIARATREHARRKLAEGAVGSARRNWLDTVLRADALIEILTCLGQLGDPA